MSDRSSRSTPPTVAPDVPDLEGVGDKEVAQRLAMAFATFMVGQTHPSESDYPYDPFWAELPATTRLTRKAFRDLLGFEASREIVMGRASRPAPPSEGDWQALFDFVVYDTLLTQMQAMLGELTDVLARGESIVAVPYFLFGRLKSGNLCGLRSTSIET